MGCVRGESEVQNPQNDASNAVVDIQAIDFYNDLIIVFIVVVILLFAR